MINLSFLISLIFSFFIVFFVLDKINSISWHSTEPWIIAAAGDEKLVKIFNINDKMEVVPTSKTKRSLVGYTSLNSPKINFNEDDFPEYDNLLELYEKKIFTNTLLSSRLVRPTKIHQINLSGEALKIQWCSSSFSFLNSSTLSSFSPSTSTSTSLSPSKAYFNNFLLIQSNTMQNQTYIDIYSPFFSHIPMCSTVGNESIKSATFIVLPKFSKEREENSSGTAIIPKEIKSNNYSYCILTANSYGKLIAYNIQYLKTFYPRICPSLAVVSAQGFLAIHRGSIKKPLEIVNKIFSHNKNKKKMYIKKKMDEKKRSLLKSYDSLLPFVVKNDKNNKEISPSSTATLSENILAKSLGNVWVALPDFRNLEEARDIRLIGSSANASVFDPALISLLARNYSMTHGLKLPKSKLNITQPSSESIDGFKTKEEEENEKKKKEDGGIDGREEEDHYSIYDKPSEENLNKVPNEKQAAALAAAAAADAAAIKIEDPLLFGCDNLTIEEKIAAEFEYQFALYEDAIEACNHNYEVALRAGLKCRASVWATMVSLIPIPSLSNSILNQIKKDLSEDSENKIKNLNKYFFLSLKTSSELSFSIELIGNLLNELLTSGDSQHFVVMREILRRCDLLPLIDQVVSLNIYQIRQMYLAYIDLLQRLKLFNHACEIKANIDDEILANLSRKAIDIYIKCSQCKKDLKIKNLSNRSATVWCSKCKECVSKCCFCLKPINGLLQMCPICSHGGHIECMSYWFAMHSSCPSGCTHECSPEYAQLSSNYLFRNNSLTNPSICSGVSPSNNGQFSNNYFCQPTLIYRRNFYRGARMKQLKARFG